jgi:hypothetical protein
MFWSNLNSLEKILENSSSIKFNENPPSGSRIVPCGQTDGLTDRYDESNSRFSQFCERDLKNEFWVLPIVTSKWPGLVQRLIEMNEGYPEWFQNFEGAYYTHRQDRLIQLNMATARSDIRDGFPYLWIIDLKYSLGNTQRNGRLRHQGSRNRRKSDGVKGRDVELRRELEKLQWDRNYRFVSSALLHTHTHTHRALQPT